MCPEGRIISEIWLAVSWPEKLPQSYEQRSLVTLTESPSSASPKSACPLAKKPVKNGFPHVNIQVNAPRSEYTVDSITRVKRASRVLGSHARAYLYADSGCGLTPSPIEHNDNTKMAHNACRGVHQLASLRRMQGVTSSSWKV